MDNSYTDHNELYTERRILFSLISQSKNHLNLEIISDTWHGLQYPEDDDTEIRLSQSNLKEGGGAEPRSFDKAEGNTPINLKEDNIQILNRGSFQTGADVNEGGDQSIEQNLLKDTGNSGKTFNQIIQKKDNPEQ